MENKVIPSALESFAAEPMELIPSVMTNINAAEAAGAAFRSCLAAMIPASMSVPPLTWGLSSTKSLNSTREANVPVSDELTRSENWTYDADPPLANKFLSANDVVTFLANSFSVKKSVLPTLPDPSRTRAMFTFCRGQKPKGGNGCGL